VRVIHELKSWPEFFRQVVAGVRTHELRLNDRDFNIGDVVRLREFDPGTDTYTGSECDAAITSLTSADVPCAVSGYALDPRFCILSIRVTAVHHPRAARVRICDPCLNDSAEAV
jgi:hypothetical protein